MPSMSVAPVSLTDRVTVSPAFTAPDEESASVPCCAAKEPIPSRAESKRARITVNRILFFMVVFPFEYICAKSTNFDSLY